MVTLGLENIGCIAEAGVKVGGLTVLTGYNDIGKSTIGKVMFMLVKTATDASVIDRYKELHSAELIRVKRELEELDKMMRDPDYDLIHRYHLDSDVLRPFDNPEHKKEILESGIKDHEYAIENASKLALSEYITDFIRQLFHGDLQNRYSKKHSEYGVIKISNKDTTHEIKVTNGFIRFLDINLDPLKDLFTDVTFIDSPLIFLLYKLFRDSRFKADRSQLVPTSILEFPIYRDLVEKIITPLSVPFGAEFDPRQIAIRELFLKLSARIQGSINEYHPDQMIYRKTKEDGTHSDFPMVNVASGIKSLGLLGLLMENGYVQPRHLLVIDEPESHLHPQWEVLYGKLLVQLAMENVPIIVSTHSSTLLEAIIRASEKLDAEYLVNYYVGDKTEKGTVFTDVTDDKAEVFRKITESNREMFLSEIEQW